MDDNVGANSTNKGQSSDESLSAAGMKLNGRTYRVRPATNETATMNSAMDSASGTSSHTISPTENQNRLSRIGDQGATARTFGFQEYGTSFPVPVTANMGMTRNTISSDGASNANQTVPSGNPTRPANDFATPVQRVLTRDASENLQLPVEPFVELSALTPEHIRCLVAATPRESFEGHVSISPQMGHSRESMKNGASRVDSKRKSLLQNLSRIMLELVSRGNVRPRSGEPTSSKLLQNKSGKRQAKLKKTACLKKPSFKLETIEEEVEENVAEEQQVSEPLNYEPNEETAQTATAWNVEDANLQKVESVQVSQVPVLWQMNQDFLAESSMNVPSAPMQTVKSRCREESMRNRPTPGVVPGTSRGQSTSNSKTGLPRKVRFVSRSTPPPNYPLGWNKEKFAKNEVDPKGYKAPSLGSELPGCSGIRGPGPTLIPNLTKVQDHIERINTIIDFFRRLMLHIHEMHEDHEEFDQSMQQPSRFKKENKETNKQEECDEKAKEGEPEEPEMTNTLKRIRRRRFTDPDTDSDSDKN